MSGLISGLAGAGGAAANANNYVNNAASQFQYGSGPTLQYYTRAAENAMRPQINATIQNALDQAAAQGLGRSGAGQYDIGNAAANAASGLSAAIAPIYSQALGIQGNIQSQAPGLEEQAYNQSIQDLYQGIGSLGSAAGAAFGFPSFGGGGGYSGGLPPGGYYSGGVPSTQGGDPYLA